MNAPENNAGNNIKGNKTNLKPLNLVLTRKFATSKLRNVYVGKT